jgi:hypothetical protein
MPGPPCPVDCDCSSHRLKNCGYAQETETLHNGGETSDSHVIQNPRDATPAPKAFAANNTKQSLLSSIRRSKFAYAIRVKQVRASGNPRTRKNFPDFTGRTTRRPTSDLNLFWGKISEICRVRGERQIPSLFLFARGSATRLEPHWMANPRIRSRPKCRLGQAAQTSRLVSMLLYLVACESLGDHYLWSLRC